MPLIRFCFIGVALILASCAAENNPLSNHDPKEIAAFLFENSGPAVGRCAKYWAAPEKATPALLQNCDEQAFFVANQLTEQGYGDVSAQNATLPAIWQAFVEIGDAKGPTPKFEWGEILKPEVIENSKKNKNR